MDSSAIVKKVQALLEWSVYLILYLHSLDSQIHKYDQNRW
jgi:hypothetical protein